MQQFLGAISHSVGAHTAALDVVLDASDAEDNDRQQQQQQLVAALVVANNNRYTGSSTTRGLPTPPKDALRLNTHCILCVFRTVLFEMPYFEMINCHVEHFWLISV